MSTWKALGGACKDLAALITLAWTGQLTLATKYILNFIGVDHGLGIGLALLGLLLAGLKLEHILIHGLMDAWPKPFKP